ncbi:MAG: precorrin-3B C(17)-methyltransferase [Rhodospirillales bacterium]|nr:precorrin-3B C(17)-methyltransferase [Rhodospirillales bacterium]
MNTHPVFVALNETGARLARRLMVGVVGAELHGYDKRIAAPDVPFARAAPHLRELFTAGRPVVAIMSTGIVIRALGDLAVDKHQEAAVICIGESGESVVPLLGGHRGGNRLARQLAAELGIAPAITTAGDARFGYALDEPPAGWGISNPDAAKEVMAALLAGEAIGFEDDTGAGIDKNWLALDEIKVENGAGPVLAITERAVPPSPHRFALHPRTLIAGVGCERGAGGDEIVELVRSSLASEEVSERALACLASIDIKEDEAGLIEAAAALGVPLRLFGAAELERQTPRVTEPSDYVFETVGCHSVSEAAALAGAGDDGRLLAAKRKSERATCAIARAPAIVDPETLGRGRGRLVIVGIGPGNAGWRAPDATSAIAGCSDLVGYGLYIELLGGLADGKVRHDYPLGEERERVAAALDLAAAGKQVALISSGDAGIYAMGSLVFELIDQSGEGGNQGWRRIDVEMVPGISALQAAAARTGAPLGHDFCAISLSDLMTPWPVIERRIEAAAEGDFVIALYNPVSKRRRRQFEKARAIIGDHRPPETPVIIARNLGRDEEQISVLELQALATDLIDMLTVVIIGSSETRIIREAGRPDRVYTPRGYGDQKP